MMTRADAVLELLLEGRTLHRNTVAAILGLEPSAMESPLTRLTWRCLVFEDDNGMIGLLDPVAAPDSDPGRDAARRGGVACGRVRKW